ncbi:hypothetical protein [Terrisporobacter sp.]|uniref:hypothetical protein n=1 Tax=Terrisporobacter sp. TaxID=1965305 RepID=UPI00289A0C89|nr:hypothetical protein [Terrisporobacter sp.]
MNYIKEIISSYIEDFFMLIGIAIFVLTTYEINIIAGKYLMAIIFISIGYKLSKKPRNKNPTERR